MPKSSSWMAGTAQRGVIFTNSGFLWSPVRKAKWFIKGSSDSLFNNFLGTLLKGTTKQKHVPHKSQRIFFLPITVKEISDVIKYVPGTFSPVMTVMSLFTLYGHLDNDYNSNYNINNCKKHVDDVFKVIQFVYPPGKPDLHQLKPSEEQVKNIFSTHKQILTMWCRHKEYFEQIWLAYFACLPTTVPLIIWIIMFVENRKRGRQISVR